MSGMGQVVRGRSIDPHEIGGTGRIGGICRATQYGIWAGKPPVCQEMGIRFQSLAIMGIPPATALGQTVTVDLEAGTGYGGRVTRRFCVGGGLSATLRVGNYEHVRAVITAPQPLLAGMEIPWLWSTEVFDPSPLFFYQAYTVPGALLPLPEGCAALIPELACTITFQLTQFGALFARAAIAGERVPAMWGAYTCNVATDIIYELRGL